MCGRLGDNYWVGACGGQRSGMKSDSTAGTRHKAPRWCYVTAIFSDLLGVRVGKRGANGVEGERCLKVCPRQASGKPRRLWAQRRSLRVVRNPAHVARATAGRARRPANTCRRLEAALCGAAYLGRAPFQQAAVPAAIVTSRRVAAGGWRVGRCKGRSPSSGSGVGEEARRATRLGVGTQQTQHNTRHQTHHVQQPR